METILKVQCYRGLKKSQRGIVRRFLVKVTGLSRAQTTRLTARWMETREILPKVSVQLRFPRRYTSADIVLLATVDAAHEGLSGPAVRRILWREHNVYGKAGYARLAVYTLCFTPSAAKATLGLRPRRALSFAWL